VQERAEYSADDQPIPKPTPLYPSGFGLADKPKRQSLPKTDKRARHVGQIDRQLHRRAGTSVLPPSQHKRREHDSFTARSARSRTKEQKRRDNAKDHALLAASNPKCAQRSWRHTTYKPGDQHGWEKGCSRQGAECDSQPCLISGDDRTKTAVVRKETDCIEEPREVGEGNRQPASLRTIPRHV